MRATLSFSLPEEQYDFETANNASRYKSSLFDLDCYLREKIKYCDLPPEKEEVYQEIRDKLHEILGGLEITWSTTFLSLRN